jgi:hypothetical protein
MVHLKTYATPPVPEKLVILIDGSANEPPDPLTLVHVPVPIRGLFPSRVTTVVPQVATPV